MTPSTFSFFQLLQFLSDILSTTPAIRVLEIGIKPRQVNKADFLVRILVFDDQESGQILSSRITFVPDNGDLRDIAVHLLDRQCDNCAFLAPDQGHDIVDMHACDID